MRRRDPSFFTYCLVYPLGQTGVFPVTNFLLPFLSLQVIVLLPLELPSGLTVTGFAVELGDGVLEVLPLDGAEIVNEAAPFVLALDAEFPSLLVNTVTEAVPPFFNPEIVTTPDADTEDFPLVVTTS
jgi:hypothetical protein